MSVIPEEPSYAEHHDSELKGLVRILDGGKTQCDDEVDQDPAVFEKIKVNTDAMMVTLLGTNAKKVE